jgi:2-polyprenyl-3-methyl-5-hydroxy-6-metoxy-1,4-benzoquinol methylase
MSSPTLACGHSTPSRYLLEGRDRLCGVPGHFSVARCATCGLVSTLPRLDPGELDDYYPDSYMPYREMPERLTLRQRLGGVVDDARFAAGIRFGAFRALTRAPPGRLLDVGCGRGDLAEWFSARGWHAAGVEPSAAAARQAAARGLEMHVGTLDDAPWPPASFDAVTFNHSLEHVTDPALALRHASALLSPGGRLVVSVPNFGAWQRRLFGTHWFPLDLPRHLQHFDRASLASMARAAGLDPVEERTSSTMGGFVISLQYRLKGKRFWSDAATNRSMHLLYPLVVLADIVMREADCLHLVARRS